VTGSEDIRLLLDQQRYVDLVTALEEAAYGSESESSELDEWSWTLLLRCRMEQGLMREALALAVRARRQVPEGGGADLWCRYVTLVGGRTALTPRDLDGFIAHCAHRAAEADGATWAGAVAADLYGRGLAIRLTQAGLPSRERAAAAAAFERAADAYHRAGLPQEGDRATRQAASVLRGGPGPDLPRARELLASAAARARARGDALALAELDFAVAELNLGAAFADSAGRRVDLTRFLAALQDGADRIDAAGGCLGEPRALWAVGKLLLEQGFPEGVEPAESAARGFRRADAPGWELPVWLSLEVWYTRRGDAAGRERAGREAAALTERTGNALAGEARAVGEADAALRGGSPGRAEALTDGKDLLSGRFFVGQAVVRSSILASKGMNIEAIELLRAADRELCGRAALSGLLPQVLISLANLVAGTDSAEAHDLLGRGAVAARALGLPVEEAQCLAMRAWVAVAAANRDDGALAGTAAPEGDFDRAVALLEPLTTLEAHDQMVSVCQQRGQAAFFSGDLETCAAWLGRAESVARAAGLGLQLAFTLSYQALVLAQAARGVGPHLYDEADNRLAQAQELLITAGLRGEIWRTLFHRGVCALEAGDRSPDAQERARRWTRADTLLTAAVAEIDRLRTASTTLDTGPLRSQVALMDFGNTSHEEVYRLGFELHWHRRSDPAQALRWLERAKARALLDGLAALTPTDVVLRDSPQLARERALQQRPAATDHEELALRQEIDALHAVMRDGSLDGYTQARTGEPPSYDRLRAALREEERAAAGRRVVVAEYRCAPRETLLFGLRADWDAPRVTAVGLDHARLSRFAAQNFRRPGRVREMQDLADGGERDWHSFAPLVAPLAEWTAPGDIVFLVPHGVLHDLPLHTLPVAGEPLLLRNPVAYSPSSAVLLKLFERKGRGPAGRAGTAAVFADSLDNLPRSGQEGRTVARLLSVQARLGAEVTSARVLDALATCALVHLAGHGRLSTGDGFERGMETSDGVIRASDLLGRQVAAGLVVLSGCETGVNEHRPGDEPVGLTRGLLLAGGASVLVSQWKVADTSAAELLSTFHRALAGGLGCADALQQAARQVARAASDRQHFYHWGAFVNVGDWR
jgi:hypothetical protein